MDVIAKPLPLSRPLSDSLLSRNFAGGLYLPSGAVSGPLSLLNAQKLSLPPNTPVGTEVMVIDWEAAGLAGPHQRLKAPSTEQGGVFVSGGTQDGIFTTRGTSNGKDYFNLLGFSDDPDTSGIQRADIDYGNGSRIGWHIKNDENLGLYYSLSPVATPDLASNWKNASDDSPASITVTSVTQGELVAGVTVAGAGTASVSGLVEVDGPYLNRGVAGDFPLFFYNQVGQATHNYQHSIWPAPDGDHAYWSMSDSEDVGSFLGGNPANALPWSQAWSPNDGNPPAPTVTRNDVASEANWETIAP